MCYSKLGVLKIHIQLSLHIKLLFFYIKRASKNNILGVGWEIYFYFLQEVGRRLAVSKGGLTQNIILVGVVK